MIGQVLLEVDGCGADGGSRRLHNRCHRNYRSTKCLVCKLRIIRQLPKKLSYSPMFVGKLQTDGSQKHAMVHLETTPLPIASMNCILAEHFLRVRVPRLFERGTFSGLEA